MSVCVCVAAGQLFEHQRFERAAWLCPCASIIFHSGSFISSGEFLKFRFVFKPIIVALLEAFDVLKETRLKMCSYCK